MGGRQQLALNPRTPITRCWYNGSANRLTAAAYDEAGNLQRYAPFTNTYDVENRLVSSNGGSTGTAAYAYDGEGKRVQVTSWIGITVYAHDALNQLAAEYGVRTESAAGTQYVGTDALGSVRPAK